MALFFTCSFLAFAAQGTGLFFQEPLEPVDTRFNGYQNPQEFQNQYVLLEVIVREKQDVEKIYKLEGEIKANIDIWNMPTSVNETMKMMIEKKDLNVISKYLSTKQIQYSIVEHNLDQLIRNENAKSTENVAFSAYSGYDYSRYHNNNEIVNELRSLAYHFPSIASMVTIGRTYEGRTIRGIKISAKKDASRKTFFMMCGIHAREWVSPATCMYMINKMLTLYKKDTRLTVMLDRMDWLIIPVSNVDGYTYTWSMGRARLWRKTRTPYAGGKCHGADPNRNFNHMWGVIGTSNDPCSNIYKGPRPFSEECVRSIANYMWKMKDKLAGFADIHAFSQMWLTSWGYTKIRSPDHNEQVRVAKAAVNALTKKHGTQYKYGPASIVIYPTSGSSDDWVYSKLRQKYSYTVELRDTGRYGFILPANQIVPTGEETLEGFIATAREIQL